ncbi:uncharacterized protein FIBRA_07104 [Fibroporia radiculosa]|uniref:Ras-GEF domain-containing protein n=1 Tax=Fibroporia radiculosa TaxID=599839 RepID=J4I062_9APHY|nr:uncharacterized protein FIBRA_07104 [Fibroporia radiculosa]CCM04907.1 predicted protein [Fibroporia radiculosa]
MDGRIPSSERDSMDSLVVGLAANAHITVQSLEALLAAEFDQSDISQGGYVAPIELQKSHPVDIQGEDVVDMELALSRPGIRAMKPVDSAQASSTPYHSSSQSSDVLPDLQGRSRSGSLVDPVTPTWPEQSESGTLVAQSALGAESPDPLAGVDEEDPSPPSKSPPRAAAARKLVKLLGEEAPRHVLEKYNADSKPWYLRQNYDPSQILIDPDGAVRAGAPAALIERLTAHEYMDPTFNQNFLLTFKSFLTVDELFDLLVSRFSIEAPDGLAPAESDEWKKMKQKIIQARVLNIFKTMVTEDGILEKEDMGILGRLKEFASREDVANSAAKRLLIFIERAQRGEYATVKISPAPLSPPPPVLPRSCKKLKLLDIEPVEIARQLTLMEFAMYKKIRPMECLLRSKETKPGRNSDNFSSIIQLSNKIAHWVAETVLEKEDPRERANIIKHFISTAENYSSMAAIVSGLVRQPIRRLRRTWERVNARYMTQLRDCESTLDTNKNFNNYRSTLARIAPPCVPFIGVYLTTLTFIHDGAEDKLAGMINFRKRQKAAEVIQDIKRWQSKPYNLQAVASVLSFLEECVGKYSDGVDYADQFWNLSLEREPREREDEKMARLLQESGFL